MITIVYFFTKYDNYNFHNDNFYIIVGDWFSIDTNPMNESTLSPLTYRLIFAQNVRQIRRLKELSQEELAHLAGVSRIYIGEVERGDRNVTIDVMGRIANALNIPLEQLLIRDLMKFG